MTISITYLWQVNGSFAKETEATPHGVKVVNAWKDGSLEVFTYSWLPISLSSYSSLTIIHLFDHFSVPKRSSGTVGTGDNGFRTDSQIAVGRGIDRGLVKAGPTWMSAGDGSGGLGGDAPATTMMTTTSAEAGRKGADARSSRGSIGNWDQFSASEMKFRRQGVV